MGNDINNFLQGLVNAKRQGKTPQSIMNVMMQQNPQMQQSITQIKNMANGRTPQDFIMQLAKQRGLDQNAMNMINELLGM